MEIADLGLSVRTFNAVCRAGIRTIPELYHKYQLEPEWLHRVIGQKHTQEVGAALAKHREEVWEELRKEDENFREPMAGDYLADYDRDLWGEEVTFDELAQMAWQLVIVNDSWYPEDYLEEDGEGDVLLVTDADGDAVHLRGDTPKIYEITRLAMDDSVKTRYCTKVWKVKGSEAEDMIEETKSTVIVSGDYTRAVALTRSIIANAQAAQQSLYEVCKGLKEMRDGKLYRELGYQNFEEYCENEVEITYRQAKKYVAIASGYEGSQLPSIGTEKLYLLAKLDEPTRQEVTESVDVDSITVKELKAQIAALQSAKESAEADAAQAKDAAREAEEAKERARLTLLDLMKKKTDRVKELEAQIKELERNPQELVVVDHTEEIDRLNAEVEKLRQQLAEKPDTQLALDVEPLYHTDSKALFKPYLTAAADAVNRLAEFIGLHGSDPNYDFFIEKMQATFDFAQQKIAMMKGA